MSKPPRKLDCDQAIRMLFEYLDNELDEHDHEAIEAHLHDCRACFSRMEFDKRLKGMIKEDQEEAYVSAPDALRGRVKKITDMF